MADLLECLIQIKALEHTISRLERLMSVMPGPARASAASLVAGLVRHERTCGRLGLGRPGLATHAAPGSALHAFVAERRANLEVLQACSASALGSAIDWPGRGPTTVADLVAIMLANDTDIAGELQRLARATGQSLPE